MQINIRVASSHQLGTNAYQYVAPVFTGTNNSSASCLCYDYRKFLFSNWTIFREFLRVRLGTLPPEANLTGIVDGDFLQVVCPGPLRQPTNTVKAPMIN